MGWTRINNSEPDSLERRYSGICPQMDKPAEVTTYYWGSKWCKTDLQKTYRRSGMKCSLLEETGKVSCSCIRNCPFVSEEYL